MIKEKNKKSKKEQTQKLLATVVMGMNLVNAAAPVAALAAAEPQTMPLSQPAASEAQPLDYAVLPQALDYLDRAIFATAEATEYDGNSSVAYMGQGDSQTITAGQNGTVGLMGSTSGDHYAGGTQYISSGGTGTVETMNNGHQLIVSGGTGIVSTMSGGFQEISAFGTGASGIIYVMDDGSQDVGDSTEGTIIVMNGGEQTTSDGDRMTIVTMNGGRQFADAKVNVISTMNDGTQIVRRSATIYSINGGTQLIEGGGTGTVDVMNSGLQYVSDGCAIVNTMEGGTQVLRESGWFYYSAIGLIDNMKGGSQEISSGGKGTVNTMNGGTQFIYNSGAGTVSTMNSGGSQEISSGGSGTVDIMNGGEQRISSGGEGTVTSMNSGGVQNIKSGGIGTVTTINGGGTQTISGGGQGTVDTMNGGEQNISFGSGIVSTMNGGTQANLFGSVLVSSMNGGTQIISGGEGTVSALNGGTQVVSNGGTSLDTVLNSGGTVYQNSGALISNITYNGGVQIIDNITADYDNMTLGVGGTNVTMGVISGAQMSGTILNSGGMQLVLDGGTALATEINAGSMQLASGGVVSGLTMSGGSLELEGIDSGSFTISGTLKANNGTIDMTDSSVTRAAAAPAYETLTIADLKGSGNTFIMDTNLAGGQNSDKLVISNADVGTHYVQIRDLSLLNGVEVKGEQQQLLITDSSGKLTFAGKELNLGGLFDIDPTLTNGAELGLSDKDWYLTKIAKTVNNDTQVLLDAVDNSYAMWRNTNDSLRSRLGALGNGSERADGIWARTQAGRFSGSGYEGRYNMYQLGYDQALDGQSTYGFAVDYGDGTGTYDPGSSKDKLAAFSLYGVWQGGNGVYTNVTARAGMFDTDLNSYGDFPDKASYKQHAYSVSVEYGQRFDLQQGLFFEPQAQFTLGHLKGINYTTDRGANGHIDAMNSAIGRIGFVMGQKITGGSDIYLKADLLHEFAGKRDLQLTSDAGGTNDILSKHNDYGDTWFELGLGANIKLSKDSSFYGEVERGFGGDINKKWSVNAGLRFTF